MKTNRQGRRWRTNDPLWWRKAFSIAFTKEKVEISEKSKSLLVTVGIEESLVMWLVIKIKVIVSEDFKHGFLGRRKGKVNNVIVNIKSNKGGSYSLCFVFFRKAPRIIVAYISQGEKMDQVGKLFYLLFSGI